MNHIKNLVSVWCHKTCVGALLLAALFVSPSFANSLNAGPVVGSTDFAMFGISGLRGTGIGTITVSGISGTVTKAVLVWHGVSSSATAVTQGGSFNGTPVVGTNIGISADNFWSQPSSQAFQADVTSLVTGNGAYSLTNMSSASSPTFDPNGASLLIYFNDGNPANNHDIAVFWGNDSNQSNSFDPIGWSATLSGINYTTGAAMLNLIVSDGQTFSDGTAALINGTPFAVPVYAGTSLPLAPGGTNTGGGLWDHFSGPVDSYLVVGTNTLNFSATFSGNDALSLIAAVFVLPSGTVAQPVSQTITFGSPPTPTYTSGGSFIVSASASSGLPVTYSSLTPVICTSSGSSTIVMLSAGTCTIAANQAGDSNYSAAPQVTQTITITTTQPTVTSVPTLSEWGMIILSGILAMGTFVVMRRRQL